MYWKSKSRNLKKNETICLVDENKILGNFRAQKLYTFEGLEKKEVDEIISGDIVGIAGISEINICQTITHQSYPFSLPKIKIDEQTIKITIGPNTSPFAGKEGKFITSRQIKERLLKEKQINLGLKIEKNFEENNFIVSGRGELHLSILIETMRREGFELQISKLQVIYKNINGVEFEPYEEVTIDCDKEFMREITEEFGKRKGELLDMITITKENNIRLKYKISDNNLLGIRSILMTKTRGTAIMSTYFLGYFPKGKKIESLRNGALIAVKSGEAVTYGLINAQERGTLFVSPGEKIYEGMVVGVGTREFDIEVNVCKEKKLTNNRSAGEGVSIPLIPAVKMTLEQCLDFIVEDKYLEVITPLNLRIRKKILSLVKRRVAKRIENKNN